MSEITVVLPYPKVSVVGGRFEFAGKARKVPRGVANSVLDYLTAVGVYNLEVDARSEPVGFSSDFSVEMAEVDRILALIDTNKLVEHLNKNSYAVLMTKGEVPEEYKDPHKKSYLANTNRVTQELVCQKLSGELKLPYGLRHLKIEEAVELMYSDETYKSLMKLYYGYGLEVIEVLDKHPLIDDEKSIFTGKELELLTPTRIAYPLFTWHDGFECPSVSAKELSQRHQCLIAILKRKALD